MAELPRTIFGLPVTVSKLGETGAIYRIMVGDPSRIRLPLSGTLRLPSGELWGIGAETDGEGRADGE